ncbi:MAG: bacteriohemerythrin [Bdellovibrionales bacterium]
MPFLEWNKGLEIGNPTIDAEHAHLMETINALHDLINTKYMKEELQNLVDEVARYSVYHFNHEESLFRSTAYPYADMHVKEHREMIKRIGDIQEKMNAGDEEKAAVELMMLLKEWLIHHIQTVDIKITPYIKTIINET